MPTKPNMRRRSTKVATSVGEDTLQAPVSSRQAHAEPARPNPYPHRLSVDVDHDTYRALRFVAAEEGCRLVDLVRVAIAHELASRL
jgi:hypothetical protein